MLITKQNASTTSAWGGGGRCTLYGGILVTLTPPMLNRGQGFFSDIDRFFLRNVQKFLSYFGQYDQKIFKRCQDRANKFRKPFCLNLFKKVLQKAQGSFDNRFQAT